MPIYEYHCDECERDFEALVRGGDELSCDSCGSSRLTKLLSLPAAHTASGSLPIGAGPAAGPPCGMGGCGLPECEL